MEKAILIVLIALVAFKDKFDKSKIYQSGDKLQTGDLARVNDLVKRGLCEICGTAEAEAENPGTDGSENLVEFNGAKYELDVVKAALKEIGAGVNVNAKVKGVTDALAKLSEEQQTALQEKLTATE